MKTFPDKSCETTTTTTTTCTRTNERANATVWPFERVLASACSKRHSPAEIPIATGCCLSANGVPVSMATGSVRANQKRVSGSRYFLVFFCTGMIKHLHPSTSTLVYPGKKGWGRVCHRAGPPGASGDSGKYWRWHFNGGDERKRPASRLRDESNVAAAWRGRSFRQSEVEVVEDREREEEEETERETGRRRRGAVLVTFMRSFFTC
ncbi:hypothetical protein D5F01_LYC16935 [Larimichthys crocea]|uniref:Uncharacterized protein n=1 Tax=Larimichthys crocea TaxID=215358 RepID=A0A6G0I1S4_LARCR|nr:hypothetical protein D5F01_LYC16935 [Larimichthys crocea]